MAQKESSGILLSKRLDEIIDETGGSDSIFVKYKPKEEIGQLILNDLYSTYSDTAKGRGFWLTDDSKDIGILSQCQSLQALMLLASEFDLKFDVDYNNSGRTIRQTMDEVIDDILNKHINTLQDSTYVFDASPYESYKSNRFNVEHSYIDAIRWVVPTFLLVLQYHADQKEECKWEKELIDIIRYGIKYLNDAFIGQDKIGTPTDSDKLILGWNFTKDCEEPSLYYTFAVCECYISIFRTFDKYLLYLDAVRTESKTEGKISIPEAQLEYKAELDKDYEDHVNLPDPGWLDQVNQTRKIARYGKEYERVRLYKLINDNMESIDGTLYGELENRCKAVANEIWRLVKDDFADSFFYNDLHSRISQDDIKMSTTSDALFNSVYIINTIIDAGVDEDILASYKLAVANNEAEKAEEYLREYNELLEICQLASQKALRTYEILKKEEKEYIVDQFLIGFNENFTKHRELIKELRKRRMRVFSLLPMLIRTNNLISEYLIKYPQANMSKYLGYILENRRKSKGKNKDDYSWLWEVDGFFSASNYYYVAALGQFYAYYQEYEEKYIKISIDNDKHIADIENKHLKKLEGENGQIANLIAKHDSEVAEHQRILQEKDNEIIKLNNELQSKNTPIEDAVKDAINEMMNEQLPELFCKYVKDAAEYYKKLQYEKTEHGRFKPEKTVESKEYAKATNLVNALNELFVATLSSSIFAEMPNRRENTDDKYKKASTDIMREHSSALGAYTINILKENHVNLDVIFEKKDTNDK